MNEVGTTVGWGQTEQGDISSVLREVTSKVNLLKNFDLTYILNLFPGRIKYHQ